MVDSKIATALLGAATTAALDAALLGRAGRSRQGWAWPGPAGWCRCVPDAEDDLDGEEGAQRARKVLHVVT